MIQVDVCAAKAQYRPREVVLLRVDWTGSGVDGGSRVEVDVLELHQRVARLTTNVPEGATQSELHWEAPDREYAAFGLEARVLSPEGELVASGTGAVDVAVAWWRVPRMGFVTDFSAAETLSETKRRMQAMVRLHLTCVYFYDWMYSHYQYLPDEDNFVDSMGRHLSLLVVRRKIRLAQEQGMAPVAYTSVYGAEEPFVREHPDWALYRSDGVAFSLARLFYVMDFRVGTGWATHLLEQLRQLIAEMGFAGIVIDQFGYPKKALPYPGTYGNASIDLSDHFAPFIDAADATIRSANPDARVVFHAHNNWPTRKVSGAAQAVTFIYAHSPHRTYRDLRDLIKGALSLSPEKPVVIGALPDPAIGNDALLLLLAVIHACGGYQVLLGEGDGVLTTGYFPDYAKLDAAVLPQMRAYHDFIVRYGPWMHRAPEEDVSETHAGGVTEDYHFEGVATNSTGLPGHVWTIVREHDGLVTMQLVNLLESDGQWNRPQPRPPVVSSLRIVCRVLGPMRAVYVASPDWTGGSLRPLEFETDDDPQTGLVVRFTVPRLEIWDMVVLVSG